MKRYDLMLVGVTLVGMIGGMLTGAGIKALVAPVPNVEPTKPEPWLNPVATNFYTGTVTSCVVDKIEKQQED